MSLLREGAVRAAMIAAVVGLGFAYEAWSKPRVGGSCTAGTGSCLDERTDLSCQDGTYAPIPCHGPLGCSKADGKVRCDVSGNVAGDKCTKLSEGTGACTADGKALLVCTKGAFSRLACRGSSGCRRDADGQATCDTSADSPQK